MIAAHDAHVFVAEQTLLKVAKENGMSTLREQCLQRVRDGQTTLEEVVRVTQ